jgi:hypothetical protein
MNVRDTCTFFRSSPYVHICCVFLSSNISKDEEKMHVNVMETFCLVLLMQLLKIWSSVQSVCRFDRMQV